MADSSAVCQGDRPAAGPSCTCSGIRGTALAASSSQSSDSSLLSSTRLHDPARGSAYVSLASPKDKCRCARMIRS